MLIVCFNSMINYFIITLICACMCIAIVGLSLAYRRLKELRLMENDV